MPCGNRAARQLQLNSEAKLFKIHGFIVVAWYPMSWEREMNRAQRLTLLMVLAIDALLILFPPFEVGGRLNLGHHWLLFQPPGYNPAVAGVNVTALAAKILIASVVGFTVFVLAREVSDERISAVLRRLSSPARASSKLFWFILPWFNGLAWIIVGLALIAVVWAIIFAPRW